MSAGKTGPLRLDEAPYVQGTKVPLSSLFDDYKWRRLWVAEFFSGFYWRCLFQ